MAAVLSLRDNRNSFNQNNTIQVLTYMTILYLPVGLTAVCMPEELELHDIDFMQAIFAIPDTPTVIGNKIGLPWFLGIVLILLAFTISLAILMKNFPEWREKAPRYDTIIHRAESHVAEDVELGIDRHGLSPGVK
jgi:hypothetical protein